MASKGSSVGNMASSGGVAIISVGTVCVGFPTSCPVTSRGSFVPDMTSSGGVAENGDPTLGVGRPVAHLR
jgi:hypothetical protein